MLTTCPSVPTRCLEYSAREAKIVEVQDTHLAVGEAGVLVRVQVHEVTLGISIHSVPLSRLKLQSKDAPGRPRSARKATPFPQRADAFHFADNVIRSPYAQYAPTSRHPLSSG